MAEGGSGVSLDIKQDTSQLLKMYRETTKTLGQISFFKEKINRGEKFSSREIKEAHKWIQKQITLEQKSLDLLEKTERTLKSITAQRQKLAKERPIAGTPEYQTLSKTREAENKLRGTQNVLRGATRQAHDAASGWKLGDTEPEQPSGLRMAALRGVNALTTAIITTTISSAYENAKKGWKSNRTLANLSLLGTPGEWGGIDTTQRTPQYPKGTPYGLYTYKLQRDELDKEMKKNLWVQGIDKSFDPSERLRALYSLRETGGTTTFDEAANALAMTRMGYSMEQIKGYKSTGVRGGTNPTAIDLTRVFADAFEMGMTGLRAGEYMDTIRELNEAAQRTAGNTDPESFRKTIKEINSTGSAALQGVRGGTFAQNLQEAITNPGGGIAGKLFMLRAAGFKGNLYDAMMTQAQGLTPEMLSSISKNLPKNRQGVMALASMMPGGVEKNLVQAHEYMLGTFANDVTRDGRVIYKRGEKIPKNFNQVGMTPRARAVGMADTSGGRAASQISGDIGTFHAYMQQVGRAAQILSNTCLQAPNSLFGLPSSDERAAEGL
ncbi:Uncharacterised protein [uncultured archaeon]|nr:Uncharacterised protein [uncultured archaeon]